MEVYIYNHPRLDERKCHAAVTITPLHLAITIVEDVSGHATSFLDGWTPVITGLEKGMPSFVISPQPLVDGQAIFLITEEQWPLFPEQDNNLHRIFFLNEALRDNVIRTMRRGKPYFLSCLFTLNTENEP